MLSKIQFGAVKRSELVKGAQVRFNTGELRSSRKLTEGNRSGLLQMANGQTFTVETSAKPYTNAEANQTGVVQLLKDENHKPFVLQLGGQDKAMQDDAGWRAKLTRVFMEGTPLLLDTSTEVDKATGDKDLLGLDLVV